MAFATFGLLGTSTVSASQAGTYVDVPIGGGGSIDGAFIKSTYGTTQWTADVEDYYLKNEDAETLASELSVSAGEAVGWLGASFIPGIGPYLGVIGTLGQISQSNTVSQIRDLTDDGYDVHVTMMKDEYGGTIVEYWDGDGDSVEAFPDAPQPSALHVEEIQWK